MQLGDIKGRTDACAQDEELADWSACRSTAPRSFSPSSVGVAKAAVGPSARAIDTLHHRSS